MTRRLALAAAELAADGEDAETIAAELRRLHPATPYLAAIRAADRAVNARTIEGLRG